MRPILRRDTRPDAGRLSTARRRALWCVTAASLLAMSTAASADQFIFRYGSGPWHEHPRYHHERRVIVVPPPRVIYVAPPDVIYMPAPLPAAPPVPATAASPVYQATDGRYCREYQATITVNGQRQPGFGTACLQPDGSWRIVN
jgi:hypothetical protein